MSAIATAIVGGAVVGGAASIYGSKKASESAEKSSRAQLDAQMEQLNYLKEVDKLPKQYREAALTKLAGAYGAGDAVEGGQGGVEGQQQLIDQARQSPLYGAIMGGQQAGEEAILRNASATGGLRSGNVQQNMYDYNTQLQNQALLQSYNQQLQGLQGIAGLPGQTENITNVMGAMGTTKAQGIQAQGQAWQQGLQGVSGAVGQGVGNYMLGKGMGII